MSSGESEPPEIDKRKKGKRNVSNYKSEKIKLARVKLMPYTNYKGKNIPKKEPGADCKASSVLVFWLEVTWVITLFLQLCVRNENNRMWRCWQGVVWVSGWKKTFVYGSLGTIPLIWPHKLWLAYVAGGQLIALALFHLLLSFKGRRRRKRKDRLLNGDIDSFESSRFEEVTEVLDDGLPEPIPGSSHSLSDSLAEPDTILEI